MAGIVLASLLVATSWARVWYPFDLEWMEGGMLAHAWRLHEGLPVYVRPGPDFVPFLYPPGYSAIVAALAEVLGVHLPLGRAVSMIASLAAAGAIGFGVRRAGGTLPLAFASGLAFLGTWPQGGAFFDLVRPDALAVALAGWAIVLGMERGGAVAAGLLLATAFACKHNLAAIGLPMLVGIAVRDRREALRFALAAILPALALTLMWQLRSEGRFLRYLLEVPATHELLWGRGWLDTPREWGTALPLGFAAIGLALVLRSARGRLPLPLSVVVPVALGTLVAWAGTYDPPGPNSGLSNVAAAAAFFAMGAAPVALAVRGSWRTVYVAGVTGTVGALALLMRVHDGGFVNVHLPLFWCVALAAGLLLARWRASASPGARVALAGLVAAELLWSAARIDRGRLVPSEDDLAAGWKFVARARKARGPVLSPFASWIPVYAGQPPSVHAMAVWDVDREGGPFRDDLARIESALREHRWRVVLGGNQRFLGDLTTWYVPVEEIVPADSPLFMPRTGWEGKPWRVLVPE